MPLDTKLPPSPPYPNYSPSSEFYVSLNELNAHYLQT